MLFNKATNQCLWLSNCILELRDAPWRLLQRLAYSDPDVEDVPAFGDRLHICVREFTKRNILARLTSQIGTAGSHVNDLRCLTPVLEDVLIISTEVQ
jgi:hypothetical protein